MTTKNVQTEDLKYQRARFSTRLPGDRLYTAAHFWIGPHGEEGVWRVGFTKFATRMLGEMVEHGFEVQAGEAVSCGQIIGWMEGFKATTDLYGVIEGTFVEGNPLFTANLDLLRKDPYDAGWIYAARGTPEPDHVDVHAYAAVLDETIDQILRGKPSVQSRKFTCVDRNRGTGILPVSCGDPDFGTQAGSLCHGDGAPTTVSWPLLSPREIQT